MNLKFYGASDDIFCVSGDERDEIDCHETTARYSVVSPLKRAGVIISGEYSPSDSGCWKIGIEPMEEDAWLEIADWQIRLIYEAHTTYSPVLEITNAPDDCIVTPLK